MDPASLRRGYTFDLLAWSIAVVSVLLIAGAVFGIFRYSAAAYRRVALSESQALLEGQKFQDMRAQLGRFFDRAPIVGIVQPSSSLPPRELKTMCDGLLESLVAFGNREFHLFNQSIRKLSAYESFLADYPALKTSWEKIEAMSERGDAQFTRLLAIEARVNELNGQLRGATDQYHLLARDVSELFSLQVPSESRPGVLPPFYRAGVLSGLPVVGGIRDDIASLDDLKVALEQAGGKVSIGGMDVADTFREKLQALRDTGSSVFDRFVELTKEINDLQIQAQQINSELSTLGDRLVALSRRFLLLVLGGSLPPAEK